MSPFSLWSNVVHLVNIHWRWLKEFDDLCVKDFEMLFKQQKDEDLMITLAELKFFLMLLPDV